MEEARGVERCRRRRSRRRSSQKEEGKSGRRVQEEGQVGGEEEEHGSMLYMQTSGREEEEEEELVVEEHQESGYSSTRTESSSPHSSRGEEEGRRQEEEERREGTFLAPSLLLQVTGTLTLHPLLLFSCLLFIFSPFFSFSSLNSTSSFLPDSLLPLPAPGYRHLCIVWWVHEGIGGADHTTKLPHQLLLPHLMR